MHILAVITKSASSNALFNLQRKYRISAYLDFGMPLAGNEQVPLLEKNVQRTLDVRRCKFLIFTMCLVWRVILLQRIFVLEDENDA